MSLLNDYEQLMAAQVNDRFYYLRFQAEVNGRLFQQALNDIDKALQKADSTESRVGFCVFYCAKWMCRTREYRSILLFAAAVAIINAERRTAAAQKDGG